MARAFQDYQIRQYLLGDLPAADEGALETAYFGDADLLARVELARDDLADDYAAARLSAAEREKFERRLLATPEGREQLGITRALQQAAVVAPTISRRPVWRIDRRWLSVAALVPLAIGAWFAWRIVSGPEPQDERAGARAQQTIQPEPATPPSPPNAVARNPQAPGGDQPRSGSPAVPAMQLATLILTADLDRSAGLPPTLLASSGATHVDLVAPATGLTPGASRARVESAEGVSMWSGAITVPDAAAPDPRARARVPVSVLPPGDYLLSIEQTGRDAPGGPRYYFRVRAR